MQAIAETLKDGEPEHPETDPASALLVGDEHDLTVGYALEMLAVGALAVALGGLHELVARDPTVLEGDLLHDRDGQALSALHSEHDPHRKHKLLEGQKNKALSGSAQATLLHTLIYQP